jgi:hypothetical protein
MGVCISICRGWMRAAFLVACAAGWCQAADNQSGQLLTGWASVDITPPRPVALTGQLHKRISTGVLDPLTATVLAMETRGPGDAKEQAILVSCDLLMIERSIRLRLQERIKAELGDFDSRKLLIGATHTHTGPGLSDDKFGALYDVSNDAGVMKASEYADYFLDRLVPAIAGAWKDRRPGKMSWGMGFAVVGRNRRASYFDGTAVMYGPTGEANFSHIEGPDDSALDVLFFWKPDRSLSGLVINLACTSQETENLNEVSADFWHETRLELRKRHGEGLFVLPQCAPAGDLSPRPIYRQQAELTMVQRRGLTRRQEIARRIVQAVDEAMSGAGAVAADRINFRHTVVTVDLPEHEGKTQPFYLTDPVKPVEFHVLRLGDMAMATSPFELFVDYGARIEARSPAALTMLVQLEGAHSGYLPTARAIQGGGYSADKFIVGPVGGQTLVEETVRRIKELWRD